MRVHILEQKFLRLIAAVVVAASATPVNATTYLPMSDAVLADRAELIVEVEVLDAQPSPDGVRISTDYTMRVERVLKGSAESSQIVVRVPGGEQPSGIIARVYGAPRFERGERALVFLRSTRGSIYAVEQWMLGAFHRIEAGKSAVWVRDVSGAHLLRLSAGDSSADDAEAPRLARAFSDWLASRARGVQTPPNYRAAALPGALRNATEEYRLTTWASVPTRWLAFDENRPVRWSTFNGGQPGLDGGGHAEFQAALAAWVADPKTNVQLEYAGQTTAGDTFDYYGGRDGLNFVAFEDHNLPPFQCAGGGIISTSVVYVSDSTVPYQGHDFLPIDEADIGTAPGSLCLFEREADPVRRSKLAEEILGHELGHTLGLADTSTNRLEPDRTRREALMYAFPHGDGRGARLTDDDRLGLSQLYGSSKALTCRPDASTLCLQKGRFSVEASWYNPYDGSSGSARALPMSDQFGMFSFFGPANIEAGVKIVRLEDSLRVFAGVLTDFSFGLRVTDNQTWRVTDVGSTRCTETVALADGSSAAGQTAAAAKAGACKPGPNTLCLLGGRFRAEVDWHNQFNDTSGKGKMVRQSDVAGLVYYSERSNIEMMIKLLALNGEVKLFYTPLSDLEYTLRLTEVATGQLRTYRNDEAGTCRGLTF